ncbi:MAG: hypothetical protein KGQ59_09625, partial [Bdellovibrionales bacterium]|nr:hypothetical protein [Bdellovibrionales bacterium]
ALKSGEIPKSVAKGLAPEEQMKYLQRFFSEHGLDPGKQYPRVRFLSDRLEDPEFKATQVRPEDYAIVAKKSSSVDRAPAIERPRRVDPPANPGESVRLALRRDQVQNPSDRMSMAQVQRLVNDRVQALSRGRSPAEYKLSAVDLRFDEALPEHLEAQLKLTPDKQAVISFRPDAEGKVSREAVDEELRHLEQVRKNPEKILSRAGSDPLLLEALESHVKRARGVESSGSPHVSSAGKAAVGTGLAQSLMSIVMNQDLKERGADDRASYHWVQGVGDADSVANLAIRRPLQSASLRMARGALGLGANGLGVYGAGMSAMDLTQALKEGDSSRALSSGMKTGVLGGSVARSLGRPLAERVLSEGARMAARRAATSGAAKVLGTVTGPVGLTALAVGDMAAMGIEWRTEAYYGSIEKIYAQTQFEDLRLGPQFKRAVMTSNGILGSLKSLQTNVDSDEESRNTRFRLEATALARGLATRQVLGFSIEPMASDDPQALASLFHGSAAFNPLATNVPPMIRELCRKKELRCSRKENREFGHFGDSVQLETESVDYSLAMADYVLKEKAKYQAAFSKELQAALASGAADEDWIAFHREKEKLEKEYGPKLQAEAKSLGAPKKGVKSTELTPVQKEYQAKLTEVYSRTLRSAQVSDSILEHSGIQRHVTAAEKKTLRAEVQKYMGQAGSSQKSEAGKSLEGRLVELEQQVLSRQTGQSAAQIQQDPVEARLALRKKDFQEGLAAEGVDTEKLPETVRGAIDEVLRKKLTLESRYGLLSERDPETVREIERADMQLEALLYGIQMSAKASPMTHAAVEEHARRFLGDPPVSRKPAVEAEKSVQKMNEALQSLHPSEPVERREYDSRSASRKPSGATPSPGKKAKPSGATSAR